MLQWRFESSHFHNPNAKECNEVRRNTGGLLRGRLIDGGLTLLYLDPVAVPEIFKLKNVKDMSVHNHDEEIMKNMRSQIQHDKKQTTSSNPERQSIERDLHMLDLMPQYELKNDKFIRHIMGMEDKDKALKMMERYINGRVGSAILHYDTSYVKKGHNNDFNL
jgi:hypothetical protein